MNPINYEICSILRRRSGPFDHIAISIASPEKILSCPTAISRSRIPQLPPLQAERGRPVLRAYLGPIRTTSAGAVIQSA